MQVATMNLRPTLPNIPESLKQLITQCWTPDPNGRPSGRVIIEEMERVHVEYEENRDAWNAMIVH